ncbi:MAG: hypothetical protein Q9223_007187, partial [Gallowayella weberi]
MTPRSVANSTGVDFARQLAERDASLNPNVAKKFRSSAAPKGTKLGSGYQDRTQLRTSAEEDAKATRVKALEEMVKLGQMERATFEALRDEIVGGEVKDVHLVKGLDWKLLERVRRGEDVLSGAATSPQPATTSAVEAPSTASAEDVDEEFEKLEELEVHAATKQETVKKGEMAPPPLPVVSKKRNRDDILRELKASRHAAAEKALQERQPALGPKFHKVGAKKATSRIERDDKGREVLITVDADGNVKRKVKKARTEPMSANRNLLMPDKDVKPLGLDVTVPEAPPTIKEPADDDIFAGVGGNYDLLDGQLDNDEVSDNSDDEDQPTKAARASTNQDSTVNSTPLPKQAPADLKNFFNENPPSASSTAAPPTKNLQDPTILAAFKKASTLEPLLSADTTPSEDAAKLARRQKLLEAHDRDAEDMDMG